MDSFDEIIKSRALPGVLIFNRKNDLVFLNGSARSVIIAMGGKTPDGKIAMPAVLSELCKTFCEAAFSGGGQASAFLCCGVRYSVRAVPLFRHCAVKKPSHALITIERCSARGAVDLQKVKARFKLTEREAQVIGQILKGATNQEAASALSISEHTVKDHLKKIMRKLGVTSRSMIICKALE